MVSQYNKRLLYNAAEAINIRPYTKTNIDYYYYSINKYLNYAALGFPCG